MNPLETIAALAAHNSLRASLLIVCILLLRFVLRGRIPARFMHLLWVLVAIRLLLPIAPESGWSVFNLFAAKPAADLRADPGWQVRTAVSPAPINAQVVAAEEGAPPSAGASSAPFPWVPALWLGGVVIQVALLAGSMLRLRRRLAGANEISDPRVLELARRCADETGVRGGFRVFETDAISGPAVTGAWRPRVLLPAGLHARLSDEELRFVLLHECIHLRRHDLATMWLLTAARVIHWFNPLAWLAERAARTDAELACDESVLRHEHEPSAYGRTLLRLAQSTPRRQPALLAVGIVEGRRALRTRLSRIGNPAPRTRLRSVFAALVTVVVAVAFGADEKVKPNVPNPETTAPGQKLEAVEPAWEKGWSVVRVAIPSTGNIHHAFVDLKTPEGRAVTLSEGIKSKEGVTLSKVEWIGSPVRAHIVLTRGKEGAELFADAGIVVRDDALQQRLAQIGIEAKFFEIPNAEFKNGWLMGALPDLELTADGTPKIGGLAGVLTAQTANTVFTSLAKNKDVELVSAPRIIATSQQRAVIEIIREIRYPVKWKNEKKVWVPTSHEIRNTGVTLEIEPWLGDDGNRIDLQARPRVVEFLGFADYETGKPLLRATHDPTTPLVTRIMDTTLDGKAPLGIRSRAIFSTRGISARQSETTVSIFADQTVVLVLAEVEKIDPFSAVSPGRMLIAFITGRLVSPPGEAKRKEPALGFGDLLERTSAGKILIGTAVNGMPGFIMNPYSPGKVIDVRGVSTGTKVKDPHSGKNILVP